MSWDLASAVAHRVEATAWSLDDFDDELPVPLSVFVQDKRYLGNPPLSDEQYNAVRYAERIYLPETYLLLGDCGDKQIAEYWSEPWRMVNFITLEWGKGGGKDHTCRIMSMRVAYLLLCLKSPQVYYGIPEQDTIHTLNVASSSGQANRAFFTPMRKAIDRPGSWFSGRGEALEQAKPTGRAKTLLNLVRYEKNVEAVSGHSDADTQEGLNLILGIADEVDAFKSRAELERLRGARERESSSSAEAILEMLRTSASTRFPLIYKNVRISYPRYLGSTIQQLVAEAEQDIKDRGDKSPHYVSGPRATWDVNPRVKRSDFDYDYSKDVALAKAKYECKPSRAINPYFGNEQALRACTVKRDREPLIVMDYVREGNAWIPQYSFAADLFPVRGAHYSVHADLSVKGDRAGIAMAHVKRQVERQFAGTGPMGQDVWMNDVRPFVKVDFVCSYKADPGRQPPLEIQLRWYRMLVIELQRRGFHIAVASADGYQSTDTAQILQARGIEFVIRSTDKTEQHWSSLRDLAYEARLEMPDRELTIIELLGLSRLPNGKIDHLGDSSKDEADALACAISGALEIGGQEDESGSRAWPGGDDEEWTGPSSGYQEMMPIGFARPRGLLPIGVDYPGTPWDGAVREMPLDPRGMPRMWAPDVFDIAGMGCPCSMGDGIPRCRECREGTGQRQG
jgi:hypothetical protein